MLCCLQTVQSAKANPSVLKVCNSQKLLDQFNECNKLLDGVQKVRGLPAGQAQQAGHQGAGRCLLIFSCQPAANWANGKAVQATWPKTGLRGSPHQHV